MERTKFQISSSKEVNATLFLQVLLPIGKSRRRNTLNGNIDNDRSDEAGNDKSTEKRSHCFDAYTSSLIYL